MPVREQYIYFGSAGDEQLQVALRKVGAVMRWFIVSSDGRKTAMGKGAQRDYNDHEWKTCEVTCNPWLDPQPWSKWGLKAPIATKAYD